MQLPVKLRVENGTEMEGILLDLSEDGLDVLAVSTLVSCGQKSMRVLFFPIKNRD